MGEFKENVGVIGAAICPVSRRGLFLVHSVFPGRGEMRECPAGHLRAGMPALRYGQNIDVHRYSGMLVVPDFRNDQGVLRWL